MPGCRGCCWSACRCSRSPTTGSSRGMLPIFRSMQRLIDDINRVLREQLSGIRVIRAFAREPVERRPLRRGQPGVVGHRAGRRPLAGADAAGHHAGDQPVQRRADLVRRLAYRRGPDAGRLADRLPLLLHADPDGRDDGHLPAGHAAAGVGVRRTDHRGAGHPPSDPSPRASGDGRSVGGARRTGVRDVLLPGRRPACAGGYFADRAARTARPRSSAAPARASRRWCR